MINRYKFNSGQILGRFFCFVLVLYLLPSAWAATDSMQKIDILDMATDAPASWQAVIDFQVLTAPQAGGTMVLPEFAR